jgi:hypothetical protein
MSLEQTIRNQKLQESADLAARLDQLVRAGLMPSQSIPTLKTSLSKMQSGITLHGREVAVLNDLINSMLFIVLGDDAIFNKARAGAKATYQQTREEKEKTEYDYEGDMAMSQLKSIIANSQRMHDMLSDDTNLPEWVQSKITLAEDYISTASNYMQGEMSEELKGNQHKIDANKNGKVDAHDFHLLRKKKKVAEEAEELDELSKKTMGSYVKKASGAEQPKKVMSPKNIPLTKIAAYQGDSETGHFGKRFNQATYDKAERLRKNRETGIKTAVNKLTKEDAEQVDEGSYKDNPRHMGTIGPITTDAERKERARKYREKMKKEEVEQIDEISKATMGRYINKAKDSIDNTSYRSGIKDGTAISSSTPYKSNNPLEKKLTKRHKGISMAVKKLTKEDIDAVKSMNESYKTAFNTALIEYNIKSPSELGESKRKEFFNYVDQEYKKGDK